MAIYILSGCAVMEKIGDVVYEAEVSTEVIDGVPTTVTNWVTKPNIKAGVTIGGQVAPQPVGGFISSVILGVLSIAGLWKSRQYKKAATDAIEFGQAIKADPETRGAVTVIITALGARTSDTDDELAAAGTAALLTKPIKYTPLREMVDHALYPRDEDRRAA